MKDTHDPMSQFTGKPRKFGEVLTTEKVRKSDEWDEQLKFCKWLKHAYPNILFRSDEQNAKQRTFGMQNIMQIIDPYRSGWPDVAIYEVVYDPSSVQGRIQYCGLMIEMKHAKSRMTGEHIQDQRMRHEQLRQQGWKVEFAMGFEDAKRIFLEYLQL